MREIRRISGIMRSDELMAYAKEIGAPYELVKETAEMGRLPVVNFAAGGVATPADAALMMQLGWMAFSSAQEFSRAAILRLRAKAIVEAVTHFNDPKILAEVSKGLGEPMVGIGVSELPEKRSTRRAGMVKRP